MPDIFDTINPSGKKRDIFDTINPSVNMIARQRAELNAAAEAKRIAGIEGIPESQLREDIQTIPDPADVGYKAPVVPPIQWSLADIGRIPGRIGGTLKMGGLQVGESLARAAQHVGEYAVKVAPGTRDPFTPGFTQPSLPQLNDKEIRAIFEASEPIPGTGKGTEAVYKALRIPDMLADVAQAKKEKIRTGRAQYTFRESPILYATELVGVNLPTSAVALGAGILGGPGVGLAVMAASEFGSAAEQQAQTGASINKQTAIGVLSAGAEVGGEMLVFPKILKGVKGGGFTVRGIVDLMLENAGQETVTGFAQSFLQTFGTETSKGTSVKDATEKALMDGFAAMPENAWVGGLTAGATTTSTTVAGKTIDMLKHITAVKETIESPQISDIADVDTKIEEIQRDTTIPDDQKKAITGFLGGVIGNWETKLVEKFPGEITDLKSLEKWGNTIAKELGVDVELGTLAEKHGIKSNIVWQKGTRPTTVKRAHAEGPEIGGTKDRFGVKIFDFNRLIQDQVRLKRTIIHELGHFARKPFRGDFKDRREGKVVFTYKGRGKRRVHHPEFKSWVDASVKNILTPQKTKTFVPAPIGEQGPAGEIGLAKPIDATPQGEIVAGKARLEYDRQGRRQIGPGEIAAEQVSAAGAVEKPPIGAIVKTHNEKGGSTIDLETGEPVIKGFAVAISKEYEQVIPGSRLTQEQVETYRQEHQDVLDADPRRTIGTWVDNGNSYLDISTVIQSKDEAVKTGEANKQLAIFDLGKSTSIQLKTTSPAESRMMGADNGFVDQSGKFTPVRSGVTHREMVEGKLDKVLKTSARIAVFADHIAVETTARRLTPAQINKIAGFIKQGEYGQIHVSTGEGTRVVEDPDRLNVKPSQFRRAMAGPPAPAMAEKKPSKKQLLAEGHKIQREYKVSDEDYRNLAEETTGKRSMKSMTRGEKVTFVDALREKYGPVTDLTEADLEKSIPFRGKMTPLKTIFAEVINVIDQAPSAKKTPAHIVTGTPGQGIKRIAVGAWRTFVGLRGSRPGRLAKMLGGFKSSVLQEIFRDELIERGSNLKASHNKAFYEAFQTFIKDNGITSEMLSKFSRTQHRWWAPVEAIKELMGYGVDKVSVKLNDRSYSITHDNLLDLFLQVRQLDGLAHVVKHGFVIDDYHTGPITAEDALTALTPLIKNDPVAEKLVEFWDKTAPFYIRDAVNNVSQTLVGKDIATKELWYSLDVEKTERVGKQGFAFRLPRRSFNLIEDQSILQPRKGPTGALVMGSFFDTMESVEEGVSDYVAYATPLRLARTVLSHQGIADAWRRKGYGDIYNALSTTIRNEMELPGPKGALENFILAITRGAVRGLLHFNLRTAGVQISSTAMLAKDFDANYISDGLKYAATNKLGRSTDIVPWMWARYYTDRGPRQIGGLAETAGLTLQMQGRLNASQATGILLKKSDLEPFHVIVGAAIAEYDDAQKGKLKPDSLAAAYWAGKDVSFEKGSDGWKQAIQDRFTVGRRGQQSYDKFDRSVNTSSKSTVSKIGFLFQSFHEGAKNSIQESIDDWVHGGRTEQDTKVAARKIGAVVASYVVEQLLRDSITAVMFLTIGAVFRRKYKMLKWYEQPLRAMSSAFDMIPLIGPTVIGHLRNFARTLAGDKPIYGGSLGEVLPLQIIKTVSQAPDNFGQATAHYLRGESEEGDKAMLRAINKTYEGIALPSGIPVYEIRRFQTQMEEESEAPVRRSARSGGRRRR